MIFHTTKVTVLKVGSYDHRQRPVYDRIELEQRCYVEETFIRPINDPLFSPLAAITGALLIFQPGTLVRDIAKGDHLELDEYPGSTWVVKEPPRHHKIGGWHTEVSAERVT